MSQLTDVDRALVDDAVSGSREAFDELVRRYQTPLFNLARTLVGDAALAEDLTQETFIRAYRAIGSFRADATFRTWLYRVAINVMRTALDHQSRRRLRERALPADLERSDINVSDGGGFERGMLLRHAIERALGTLTPDLRLVIAMRDLQGLEYREIAETLDIPIGTVESRIYRARQQLRPILAPLLARRSSGGIDDLR